MAHKYSSPSACGLDQRRRKGTARKVRQVTLTPAEIAEIEARINNRIKGTLHLRH